MQRSKFTAIAAAAFLAGAVGVESAQATSTSIRQVPVATANEHGTSGAAAIVTDPQLANRIFNSISVSVPTGSDWTNSEIRFVLTTGTVYNATNAVATESTPNAAFFSLLPNGAYDTFVNSKGLTAATILGKLNPDFSAAPPPADGLSANNATLVSVAWGNTVGGEDGNFQVAQFSLSADAVGTFFGRTYATDDAGLPGGFRVFQGNIVGGVLIPEPTSLAGLLAVGGGLLLRRRRRTA